MNGETAQNQQPEEYTEAWWALRLMETHKPPPEGDKRTEFRNNVLHQMQTFPITNPGRMRDYARGTTKTKYDGPR